MADQIRIEPNPRRIRGIRDGITIVDSRDTLYVWTHPYYPAWFVPEVDIVASDLPVERLDELPGHVKIGWDSMDHWLEEDVEVFVHPRDPYKRVDALASSRHVRVMIDGTVVADSWRPVIVFETMLGARHYVPATDVRLDLLTPTDTETACPYKGWANYWTATVDGVDHVDIAWSYRTPLPESAPLAGLICFYDERVDVELDGELVIRD